MSRQFALLRLGPVCRPEADSEVTRRLSFRLRNTTGTCSHSAAENPDCWPNPSRSLPLGRKRAYRDVFLTVVQSVGLRGYKTA